MEIDQHIISQFVEVLGMVESRRVWRATPSRLLRLPLFHGLLGRTLALLGAGHPGRFGRLIRDPWSSAYRGMGDFAVTAFDDRVSFEIGPLPDVLENEVHYLCSWAEGVCGIFEVALPRYAYTPRTELVGDRARIDIGFEPR